MASGQRADGRVNRRSPRYRTSEATPPPAKTAKKQPAEPKLVRAAGRQTPVTEAEALQVLRRKRRAELTAIYADADADALESANMPPTLAKALKDPELMPTALPAWDVKKQSFTARIPGALLAFATAHAELEDTFLTAEIELALWKLVKQPPRDPAVVREEYLAFLRETVGDARAQAMINKQFGA